MLEAGWTSGGVYYPVAHYFKEGERESICAFALRLDHYEMSHRPKQRGCKRCLKMLKTKKKGDEENGK